MMKILHILCTDRLSGAERVHLDILSKLKDENEVVFKELWLGLVVQS